MPESYEIEIRPQDTPVRKYDSVFPHLLVEGDHTLPQDAYDQLILAARFWNSHCTNKPMSEPDQIVVVVERSFITDDIETSEHFDISVSSILQARNRLHRHSILLAQSGLVPIEDYGRLGFVDWDITATEAEDRFLHIVAALTTLPGRIIDSESIALRSIPDYHQDIFYVVERLAEGKSAIDIQRELAIAIWGDDFEDHIDFNKTDINVTADLRRVFVGDEIDLRRRRKGKILISGDPKLRSHYEFFRRVAMLTWMKEEVSDGCEGDSLTRSELLSSLLKHAMNSEAIDGYSHEVRDFFVLLQNIGELLPQLHNYYQYRDCEGVGLKNQDSQGYLAERGKIDDEVSDQNTLPPVIWKLVEDMVLKRKSLSEIAKDLEAGKVADKIDIDPDSIRVYSTAASIEKYLSSLLSIMHVIGSTHVPMLYNAGSDATNNGWKKLVRILNRSKRREITEVMEAIKGQNQELRI